MPFLDVLVHRAVAVTRVQTGDWVEGERVSEPLVGTPFDCVLFLPQGTEDASPRGRKVVQPTLLYAPEDDLGVVVALTPEDELHVTAPELNVAEGRAADAALRWQVVGAPQPLGKPGEEPIGFQATLRRIED